LLFFDWICAAVVLTGIIPAKSAFAGMGHPAVITVAAVLVISKGLNNAGIVSILMGPGGYRFGDYWRVGLPLSLLVILCALPLILLFWPF
jgi:di/tricarboxylate transporter